MTQENAPQANSNAAVDQLRIDDLLVDLKRGSLVRDGQAIDLPDLSFRLLATLIRHAPERVDKDQLIAEVWNGVVVSDETLAQRVSLLRQALGETSQQARYIRAVRGRGYRLIPDVKAVSNNTTNRFTALAFGAVIILFVGFLALLRWTIDSQPDNQAMSATSDALAVLPFQDMSATKDQQFFADGMHEELLQRLSTVENLALISRTSVEPYRSSKFSLPEIARRLGAGTVLEGSVRIDDDRLRITVQLIDAQRDEHIWSESYNSELSVKRVFEIQAEVADQIATALELQYLDAPSAAVTLPTKSIEAYNAYWLGRYHTFRQTPTDLARAAELLEQAIVLDSQFAEAWATLGWAYSFMGTGYGQQRPHDVYPKAKEAALRAMALDSKLADARTLYADILTWYDWDFAAAEQEYLRTMELDPLNSLGYALFLSTQRRHEEAIQLVEQRRSAHPDDHYVRINAGWRYYHAGQFDQAIAAAQASMQHSDASNLLGWSLLGSGKVNRAIKVFEQEIVVSGKDARNIANLAAAYNYADRFDEASTLVNELVSMAEQRYISPAVFAMLHFSAGEPDQAFAKLDEAYEQRDREMIFLPVNLAIADYRDDPRYQALIRKIGFQ